ncbi:PAS domain-containing sensor histidine kinase [Hyphomicrobium sp. 99]|uniref:hybrid sensor histidine kinase/response regulator n=1 Tax=Hyphomicrobium sp. 99 TaxID=1163419 RepID=UPI0009E49254|nr:PAS domain-containing sensor histidine kinase [Hyphomicrobium sp. 99]
MSSPDNAGVRHFDRGQQFELLVQALSDYAIYMIDPDGFISTWNAGARRIKGYEESEIVGKHFSCFFSEEDQRRGLPQKTLSIALEAGRYESEGWRIRKDGKRFWALSVIEAIKDDQGTLLGFGKVTRDITDRHEGQQALVESERRFRLLVDSVVDYAIYMLDLSGVITNWNAGAARIKGFRADEVVGSHFSRFYTKEDRSRGLPAIALETARREGKFETEGWRLRKDGGRFWASVVIEPIRNETGELIGFAKVTRDITERRSAQEALRDSERQFRLLVSAVIDYALFMLDPNGVVINWNKGAEKIKGYRSDEVVGSHFSRFYTEEDRLAGVPARALYEAAHEGRFEGEGWRVRKDGTRFWANVVLDPIRDESGHLIGFAKITRDITERRDAQIALQRAQQQLAHAQKMEALGQLTGGIAHDFNNLLTIIGGQARILKSQVTEPRGSKAIGSIEATVQRGASLTRQLLGFSRMQRLEPQPVSLEERLPGLQSMLATSMPANTRLIGDVLPGTWMIMSDPNELELALMNLVLNARDALQAGGIITITAENLTLSGDETEEGLKGEFVALSVSDTGAGIPKDVLKKVFDPFFTTKAAGKGTGLGLSQVYGFAHQSGGTVTIDSEVGNGTRVTMFLPRAHPEGQKEPIAKDQPSERHRARILIIEDNPDVTEVTAALIMQLGYTIRLAGSADAALRILEQESFDLVFSDIMMPGEMDGLEFAKLIRSTWPTLPVLLASGSNKRVEEAQGHFTTLQKPYQITELDRAVQKLLHARSAGLSGQNLVDLQDAKRLRAVRTEKDK